MRESQKILADKIAKGEIDVNNQELFFSVVIKGLMRKLNDALTLRGKNIPHMIINTGDDKVYLAVKGQDYSIEPREVSNENYVYNMIPRCIVTPGTVNLLFDQLTSPYTKGLFDLTVDNNTSTFVAEFRRMPMKIGVNLKYHFNTFTDALAVAQQFITHLHIIQNYHIQYLGQSIMCTYKIADAYDIEKNLEFDGLSAEAKYRTFSVDLELETNMPIYYLNTAMPADSYIKEPINMMVRTPGNMNLTIENDDTLLTEDAINQTVKSSVTTVNKLITK